MTGIQMIKYVLIKCYRRHVKCQKVSFCKRPVESRFRVYACIEGSNYFRNLLLLISKLVRLYDVRNTSIVI